MTDKHNAFENLESRLQARKNEYDAISVPEAAASQAVQAGIRQASRRRKTRLRWLTSSISAAALVLLFTGCIRVSPAFASFVEQLPGMESVVSLIRQDKGLMMAIDQSLLQKVGITDEHDGGSVTVEGIITDESRMVIFYKIKGIKDVEKSGFDIDLLDENGKQLPVAFSYASPHSDSDSEKYTYEDIIDVTFNESLPPDHLTIAFKDRMAKTTNTWKVTFPVNRNLTKNMKKTVPVNQTITLDGQRITIEQAILYPTRLVLDIKYDPDNTKKIFDISDLRLVDEQGRAWRTDGSSIGGVGTSVFFESMYFSIPKKLTLQGSGLSALDKNKLIIGIDSASKTIQGGPQGVTLLEYKIKDNDAILHFSVENAENAISGLTFTNIKDSTGKEFDVKEAGWSPSVEHLTAEAWVTIDHGAAAKGKLNMEISSYPVQNRAPFSLDIPVNK